MPVVGAAHQLVTADRPAEVPHVVQQGRRDELGPGARSLGQGRGLEHVLGLGYRLAEIFAGSFGGEEVRDDPYRVGCCHILSFLRMTPVVARSPTATADSTPSRSA